MTLMRTLDRFFRHEAAGGVLLLASAIAALAVANSALAPVYEDTLASTLKITLNDEGLKKSLLLFINDGLMAVFFLLIGLELKREVLDGRLKDPKDVLLPGVAAVAGMVLPALVFFAINRGISENLSGWAIPAATDIAFALGVLALVGARAPASLKIFLLTLAILDDLGAIIIIALFYTADLKIDYLLLGLLPLAGLVWLNMRGTHRIAPFLLLGLILWFLVLRSGVHATLAGVVTALFIPLTDKWNKSPLRSLEHGMSPYVFYLIVPVFAFANAGVVLKGMSLADLLSPLPLGIALGLVVGKQLGVFAATWLMVKSGAARMPHGANWPQIYGIACLAGIGFTMSLFIGSLSFTDAAQMNAVRLGVLAGSAVSAVIGFGVLMAFGTPQREKAPQAATPPLPE